MRKRDFLLLLASLLYSEELEADGASESSTDNMAAIAGNKYSRVKGAKNSTYSSGNKVGRNFSGSTDRVGSSNNDGNYSENYSGAEFENSTSANEELRDNSLIENTENSGIATNTNEEKSSSSSIWKKIGIGVAAVAGTAAVGTGLFYGVKSLVNKFKKNSSDSSGQNNNQSSQDSGTNDNQQNNGNNSRDDALTNNNNQSSSSDTNNTVNKPQTSDTGTEYSGNNEKSESRQDSSQDNYVMNAADAELDYSSITDEKIIFEREEIDNIKTNITLLDKDLENVSKDKVPTGSEELRLSASKANTLKDTLNNYVDRLPETASSLATAAVVVGGVTEEGIKHSDIIKTQIVDDVNKMATLESEMAVTKSDNLHELAVEHEDKAKTVKGKIKNYIQQNDNRYNGRRSYRNDVYFDKPSYTTYAGSYIASHINYFPEYNIKRSDRQVDTYNLKDTLKKLDGSKSDAIEKETISDIKDILSTVDRGDSLTELQKAKLENLLSGDTIREIEDHYGVSVADHIGQAKNISDTDTRIKEKNAKERAVFEKYVTVPENNEKKSGRKKIVVEQKTTEQSNRDSSLKSQLQNAMQNNETLSREMINKIDDNKHVIENDKKLARYFENEKQSMQLVDKYNSAVERGNVKRVDRAMDSLLENESAMKRLKKEDEKSYTTLNNRSVIKDINTILKSDNLTRDVMVSLNSNSYVMDIVKSDPDTASRFVEKVNAYREMDNLREKVNVGEKFTLDDYRNVMQDENKRKILKNEERYNLVGREVFKKGHAVSLCNGIVEAIRNHHEIPENDLQAVFSHEDMINTFKEIAPHEYYEEAEAAHMKNHEKISNAVNYEAKIYDNSENLYVSNREVESSELMAAKNIDEAKGYLDRTDLEEELENRESENYSSEEEKENSNKKVLSEEEKSIFDKALSFFGFNDEEELKASQKEGENSEKLVTDEEIKRYAREDEYYDHEGGTFAKSERSVEEKEEMYRNMYRHEEVEPHHSNVRNISHIRKQNKEK